MTGAAEKRVPKIHLRNTQVKPEDYPNSPNIQRRIEAGQFALCRFGTERIATDPSQVTCSDCLNHLERTG